MRLMIRKAELNQGFEHLKEPVQGNGSSIENIVMSCYGLGLVLYSIFLKG